MRLRLFCCQSMMLDMPTGDSKSSQSLYCFRFGDVEFDESRLELRVGGLSVELEQKPLHVLAMLLSRCDEPVGRGELLDAVWGTRVVVVEQVLNNAILKLRKALGEKGSERIITIHRVGYRLLGPIERKAVGRRLLSRMDFRPGEVVPGRENFRLEIQLGSTRSNEVWLARQSKARELRVYKFSANGERLPELKREITIYRFLKESLGDRDDFVRILDWNFETAPFFLECEYGGDNLVAWDATHGRLAALGVAERLALFLQIAEAVSSAHRVGVLHKDLKPSNVLVETRADGTHKLRVADFGCALLLEPERLAALEITRHGDLANQNASDLSETGSPHYIAPELFANQVATAQSDLYALGVILYQIVVADLRRPMASGWEFAVADELLRSDIAAATDGDPTRRPPSVSDLIRRLQSLEERKAERQRSLDDANRLAAMMVAEQRMRVRRPWLIAAIVSLTVGLATSLFSDNRQRQARRVAEAEQAITDQINRFLSEDLLGAADPSGPGGAHNPTMRDVLARTAAALDNSAVTDPQTRASIDTALSNAYFGMTDYADAEKYRRDAVDLLGRALGPSGPKTLEADYALASLLVQTNRLDEAKSLIDRADQLAGARLKDNSELTLKADWTRGGYFKLKMTPTQALAAYAAAEKVRAAVEPNNLSLMVRLRDALAWCYSRLDRNADAERTLREVIGPSYTPERVGPTFWAQARIDYGIALKVLGRNDEAERVMTEALGELRKDLGADHFFVAVVQNELGDLYSLEARWDDALASLRDAYAILKKRSGEHGQATLIAAANLGVVELRTGATAQAIKDLAAAHADLAAQLGEASPQAESTAYYLAMGLANDRHFGEAAQLLSPLNPADLTAAEPREDWAPRLEALRGQIFLGQGRLRDGVETLTQALAEMDRLNTPAQDSAPFRRLLANAH
jgi:DNA-binding winged helix-turn-helix (wHTH) protein/serine/threonine protein kinase